MACPTCAKSAYLRRRSPRPAGSALVVSRSRRRAHNRRQQPAGNSLKSQSTPPISHSENAHRQRCGDSTRGTADIPCTRLRPPRNARQISEIRSVGLPDGSSLRRRTQEPFRKGSRRRAVTASRRRSVTAEPEPAEQRPAVPRRSRHSHPGIDVPIRTFLDHCARTRGRSHGPRSRRKGTLRRNLSGIRFHSNL